MTCARLYALLGSPSLDVAGALLLRPVSPGPRLVEEGFLTSEVSRCGTASGFDLGIGEPPALHTRKGGGRREAEADANLTRIDRSLRIGCPAAVV
jgi:hypothetical protein